MAADRVIGRPRAESVATPDLSTFVASTALSSDALNPAQWAYERLAKYICEFEADLDDDHEIGARLVSHGSGITFHIEDLGYHGPDLVTFYGTGASGERVQLIQHISQISVLLVGVPKAGEKAQRIGFKLRPEK